MIKQIRVDIVAVIVLIGLVIGIVLGTVVTHHDIKRTADPVTEYKILDHCTVEQKVLIMNSNTHEVYNESNSSYDIDCGEPKVIRFLSTTPSSSVLPGNRIKTRAPIIRTVK